jgi:hypothetical protein
MTDVVQDIDRPDVNGVAPKMQAICEVVRKTLDGTVGWLSVSTDDNIMSSVWIQGTLENREEWKYGIFHNASHFLIRIMPANGKRYYDATDEKVTLELCTRSRKLSALRKYTGPKEKVIAKLKAWVISQKV